MNRYHPFKHWILGSRQKIYLILALTSLTLSFYSIWLIRPVIVELNDFLGLTSHLPITYWFGLGLITLCSILVYLDKELNNKLVYLYILIILGLILFGVGVFSYATVKNPASYYPAGEVKNVLLTNHIDTLSDVPLVSYRSWPAFHLLSATILYVTNIDFICLIKYMPLFWLLLFILIIFSIGKKINISLNQSFLLSFLSLSSFWVSQLYYSPQAFAFLLYLIMFSLSITSIANNKVNRTEIFLFLLFFTVIVISHLLTTITVLLSIIFFFNYRLFKEKKNRLMLILFLIIFISWYIYLSTQVLKIGIPEFIKQVITIESYSIAQMKVNPTSQTEFFSKQFQFTYVLIYIALLATSFFLYFSKIENIKTIYLKRIYFWLAGVAFISIIAYGKETYERMYMFSLIPLVCIIIMSFVNIKSGNKLLISLMVIFMILFIPAQSGNDSISTSSQTELKGAEFFSLRIKPLDHYFDSYSYKFDKFLFYFNPDIIQIRHITFYKTHDNSLIDDLKYVLNSRDTNINYVFSFNFNPLQEWLDNNEKEVNLLYDNGYFDIYKKVRFKRGYG